MDREFLVNQEISDNRLIYESFDGILLLFRGGIKGI